VSGLAGVGFFVVSHGCRVNQYEGDAIASELLSLGAHEAQRVEDAGVVVLVSCAVTAEAERKARQEVRRLRRRNPDALLVVCGCWVNRVSDHDLLSMGVDVGLVNGMKHLVPQLVERHMRGSMVRRGSFNMFAVTKSTFWEKPFKRSPSSKDTWPSRWLRARFSSSSEATVPSKSLAKTFEAPSFNAPMARIPDPVPTSKALKPLPRESQARSMSSRAILVLS